MIVGVPREQASDETRVALIPSVAERLVEDGHEVCIQAGAGTGADYSDDQYQDVGCRVCDQRDEVFDQADVILQVRALGATDGDPDSYRADQTVIGLVAPYDVPQTRLEDLAATGVDAFALELIPRISRAQSMDALSSMASLGGYTACLMAATELPKLFPLEMTAAGTIQPADVFVIGAGVAGLKAITTAERLGASVRAYDIRLEVKQEVESLGADFVELDLETEGSGDDEGYAREMDEEFYRQQRTELTRVVADSDVVITTAAIPGKPAPELVTTEMIENMAPGSVVVDLSAESGGNCEPTRADETVTHEGVTIFGPTNLPATIAHTASQQFANNLYNFLENLLADESENLEVDLDDEIIAETLLTHDGRVRNPHVDDQEQDADDDTADQEGSADDA
jgi:NAD(P) transhydrogenase subunit alpha